MVVAYWTVLNDYFNDYQFLSGYNLYFDEALGSQNGFKLHRNLMSMEIQLDPKYIFIELFITPSRIYSQVIYPMIGNTDQYMPSGVSKPSSHWFTLRQKF